MAFKLSLRPAPGGHWIRWGASRRAEPGSQRGSSQGDESELSLSLRVECSSRNERWRAEKKNTIMNQESNKVLLSWSPVINTCWVHYFSHIKNMVTTTSLMVQWLRFHASTAGSTGLIPGGGTKIPHAAQCRQKPKVCVYICMYVYIYI